MKYFAGILLSALAIHSASATLANIKSYIASNYNTVAFWEGVVLGLQEDHTDTTHECFTSFSSWATQIAAIPTQIVASAANPPPNSVMSTVVSNAWQQPGTYFLLTKLVSESGSIFFTFYDNCYIDDMLISFGRTINSISGAFNTVVTAVTYFFNNYDTTNSETSFYSLDTYATADDT